MRLVRVTQYYEAYLKSRESRFPHATVRPYQTQLDDLLRDCFTGDLSWRQALAGHGYDVHILVANDRQLQSAWAGEHGVEVNAARWREEIVARQLASLAPDIVWLDDLHVFSTDFIRELRAGLPQVKLWMGWSGSPLPRQADLKVYDLFLSNIPEQVAHFRSLGLAAEYLPHAFPGMVSELLGAAPPDQIPFTFVGSLFSGPGGHNGRLELLAYLAKHSPLTLYASLPQDLVKKPVKTAFYHAFSNAIYRLHPRAELPWKWRKRHAVFILKDRLSQPVFALDMYRVLAQSMVTLNQHIDVSRGSASNLRLFEATGVGTCLLTDWKSNLPDFFELDREVVTYRSREECVEKFEWLSHHPREREEIARAGQRRTLADHTYSNRAIRLGEILAKRL
jgi:hypothetical protein